MKSGGNSTEFGLVARTLAWAVFHHRPVDLDSLYNTEQSLVERLGSLEARGLGCWFVTGEESMMPHWSLDSLSGKSATSGFKSSKRTLP